MAIASQLEYRFNLFVDTCLQPILLCISEVALWTAIFRGGGVETLNGFTREYYLAYALWAAFFARIAANWMYEMRMIDEIDSGTVNSILVRPISFFEFYLGQFMGYKILTSLISLLVPILICLFIDSSTHLARLPIAFLLATYYLVLAHLMSSIVSSFAFFFNRIHALTVTKNFILWFLVGELFPLDLLPIRFRSLIIALPFSSGVFIPVGYLTGRVPLKMVGQGFISITLGILFFTPIYLLLWNQGRKKYSGTGA
jgi:ABC-2 type transport system permease protein